MLKSDVVERLKNIVGENSVLTAKEDVAAYAYDGTTTWSHPPDAAVLPATAKQISSILALANENLIPKPAARRTIIAIFDNMTLAGKVVSGPAIERECKDCHAPNGSDYYRLLVRNYPPEFYAPFDISIYDLCFSCHNPDIVLVKETETLTEFQNGTKNLHSFHFRQHKGGVG